MKILQRSKIALLFSDSWNHFISFRPTRMASSLSYYAFFSLVPILIITSWIGGAIFDNQILAAEILQQVSSLIGSQSAAFIQTTFTNASSLGDHPLKELIAITALIALAIAGIAELKNSLDDIWQTPYLQPKTIFAWLLRYLIPSFATLVFGIVFAVFIIISKFVQIGFTFGLSSELLALLSTVGGPILVFLITTIGTLLIYKILPERHMAGRKIFFGAIITGLFLTLGNIALSFYLTQGTTISTYGVAGSIVAILLWFYYSALIFLFGASVTWTYHKRTDTTIS